ncbi:MAG: class I SAM-dependent methyltransferase [Candidatus Aminicenantes bacterium]|nr:class I SAM-dependent methyltransferase [Candidatus Aminicenantes bacterium]
MKRKALVLILIYGWLIGAAALPGAGGQVSGVSPNRKETTVRNLTKETVRYTIRQLGRELQPTVRYLKPNALDRWPCDSHLDINFERKGQAIEYRLECGLPYTFRYDENDDLELYSGSHGLFGVVDLAPFVPTPMVVVDKMLELGGIDKDDVLFDLGCGDGRIVITAAKKFGTRGVGIDIDPQRIEESLRAAKEAGVDPLVEFRLQDVMKADIREATAVTLYLLPESNALLRPLLEAQLKPGTPVVSHNYSIPGWEEKEVTYVTLQDGTGQEHTIFVYRR